MEREVGDGLRTSSLQGASSSGVSDLHQPLHCCGFLDLRLKLHFNTSHGVKQNTDSQHQKGLGQSPCPALPAFSEALSHQGLISWPSQQPPVPFPTVTGGKSSGCGAKSYCMVPSFSHAII